MDNKSSQASSSTPELNQNPPVSGSASTNPPASGASTTAKLSNPNPDLSSFFESASTKSPSMDMSEPIIAPDAPEAPDPVETELNSPFTPAAPVPGSIGSAVSVPPKNDSIPDGFVGVGASPESRQASATDPLVARGPISTEPTVRPVPPVDSMPHIASAPAPTAPAPAPAKSAMPEISSSPAPAPSKPPVSVAPNAQPSAPAPEPASPVTSNPNSPLPRDDFSSLSSVPSTNNANRMAASTAETPAAPINPPTPPENSLSDDVLAAAFSSVEPTPSVSFSEAPTSSAPTTAPKKPQNKKTVIILAIVAAVVIIALVVILIVVNLQNSSSSTPETINTSPNNDIVAPVSSSDATATSSVVSCTITSTDSTTSYVATFNNSALESLAYNSETTYADVDEALIAVDDFAVDSEDKLADLGLDADPFSLSTTISDSDASVVEISGSATAEKLSNAAFSYLDLAAESVGGEVPTSVTAENFETYLESLGATCTSE